MSKNKKKSKVLVFRDLPLQHGRAYNIWMLILNVLSGVCSIIQVYIVSHFINEALNIVHKRQWNYNIILSILLLLTVAVDWLVPRITNILRQKVELALAERYRPVILKKCASLKYEYVEDQKKWDLLSRILNNTERSMSDGEKRPYINVASWILALVVRMSPGWIAFDCFAMLLSSVCYAYATVVKQWLFDTITKVANEEGTYQGFWVVTILVVIFQIGNELLNAVCNFTWSPALRSTVGKIIQKIHLKVKRLPANVFEDVVCLECIEKANVGANNCYGLYNSVATILLFYLPYFIVIGGISLESCFCFDFGSVVYLYSSCD